METKMEHYVVGFAFNYFENQVGLLLKARSAWQAGCLNGIGGKVNVGESPEQAMQREFREEVRCRQQVTWRLFAVLIGPEFRVHFFRTSTYLSGLTSTVKCDGSTPEDMVIVEVDTLPRNILPNLRWLLPMASVRCSHDWPYIIYEEAMLDEDLDQSKRREG